MPRGAETSGAVRSFLWRGAFAASLVAGTVVACFMLFTVAPGDAARAALGPNASEAAVERLRHDLGTDRPLLVQFGRHVAKLGRLDMGRSFIDGQSVRDQVSEKFGVSARLALLASLLSLGISYAANAAAFWWQRPWLVSLTQAGAVTPSYCAGVFGALLFGVVWPVVPLTGYGSASAGWSALLVPAFVAAAYPTAAMSQVLREKVRESQHQGFVTAAESLGFSRVRIFHGTVLPAVLVPWIAAWINQLGVTFVASFVLENIFSIPGVGVLLVRAIQGKDYPVLQGILLVNAVFFVTVSWLGEAILAVFDPRMRSSDARPA